MPPSCFEQPRSAPPFSSAARVALGEPRSARPSNFTRLELSIAEGITSELPVNRDAVGLALAELKQDEGDVAGAIDVVEQLEPTTYSAVSLAELYAQAERWDDVIGPARGIRRAALGRRAWRSWRIRFGSCRRTSSV
jgi:hypothetical protein